MKYAFIFAAIGAAWVALLVWNIFIGIAVTIVVLCAIGGWMYEEGQKND